jgi:hypothetical protein
MPPSIQLAILIALFAKHGNKIRDNSGGKSVTVGFMVDIVVLGQAYLSQFFGFIVCQYHSTNATYSFIRQSQTSYNFQNREHH